MPGPPGVQAYKTSFSNNLSDRLPVGAV